MSIRRVVIILSLVMMVVLVGGCDSITSGSSASVPAGYSAARVIDISVVWRLTLEKGGVFELSVTVLPPKYAEAGKVYPLELYEKENLRARTKIFWSQPELNVDHEKEIYFPLNSEEQKAYRDKDVSNLFSVIIGKMPLE